MSDDSNDFNRRLLAIQQAGERLALAFLFEESLSFHETDPERALLLITRGRDKARRMGETWWELYYESWRLTAISSLIMDFTRGLPMAIEIMVRFQTPEGRAHSEWLNVLGNTLSTYTNIDPFGYRDELERGFAHMDGEIPEGPSGDRSVLHHRRIAYLSATERWDEAYDLAIRSVGMAMQLTSPEQKNWHGSWALYLLCRICAALGRIDEIAGHAAQMAELSDRRANLRRIRADARFWLAVARRAAGDERDASAEFQRGMPMLDGLERRDSICADPIARYYELAGDPRTAVDVRDRELGEIDRKGQIHRTCEVHVERCRLLALLGELTPNDLDAARQSAARLRHPDRFLDRIERIGTLAGPST